jgi:hypothetical protein
LTSGRWLMGGLALVDRVRLCTNTWSNNHGTWDRCKLMNCGSS